MGYYINNDSFGFLKHAIDIAQDSMTGKSSDEPISLMISVMEGIAKGYLYNLESIARKEGAMINTLSITKIMLDILSMTTKRLEEIETKLTLINGCGDELLREKMVEEFNKGNCFGEKAH